MIQKMHFGLAAQGKLFNMPVHSLGGGRYRWGHHGKIYAGEGAKAKATLQGRAAYASGYTGKSDTNLFFDWMNKEKCPDGNHIHSGRLYCHPINRTHPKIQIFGPHPGTQEANGKDQTNLQPSDSQTEEGISIDGAKFDFIDAETKLSYEDKVARLDYVNSKFNSEAINFYLRTGEFHAMGEIETKRHADREIEALDTAIARHKLTQDIIAYRAINSKHLHSSHTYTDKAYISVSTDREYLERLRGYDTIITLRIPKGTKFLPNRVEEELILERGSTFDIINIIHKQLPPVSDTNLFSGWMNKAKCPEGDHIHPGRQYCHPIDRIHPKIQILGPHSGTPELGDQGQAESKSPLLFANKNVKEKFLEIEEEYDLMTQIDTITGGAQQYIINFIDSENIEVEIPGKDIYHWNYTKFNQPIEVSADIESSFSKAQAFLKDKGLITEFEFVDDSTEKTRWINTEKKTALIYYKDKNIWTYIPSSGKFEDAFNFSDAELNLLGSVNETIIDNANMSWDDRLEKIGAAQGSFPGGVYKDKITNEQYYIKFMDDRHAIVEELTSNLYGLVGVPHISAAKIQFDNKTAIATKFLSHAHHPSVEELQNNPFITNAFVIDAWLANWDVAGLDYDNIIMSTTNKLPFRIDFGGALIFRALGKQKPFGDDVPELETMRNPDINASASQLFKNVSTEQLRYGAERLSMISSEQIADVVDKAALSVADKLFLTDTLIKRREYIIKNLLTSAPQSKVDTIECHPGFHAHPGYDYCHPETRKHRDGQIATKIGTQTVYKMLSKHPNQLIREIAKKAYQYDFSKEGSELQFLKENGLTAQIEMTLRSWQSGNDQIRLRAAIYELQNKADEKYATENAYFVHGKGESPSYFKKRYKEGRQTAASLIPFIIKTQQILEKKYPNGFIPVIYRGIKGNLAKEISAAIEQTKIGNVISIPHDGSSGYSLSRNAARHFGYILLTKQNVPIDRVFIYFNAFNQLYESEQEIIVDSDAVTLFTKDEIII